MKDPIAELVGKGMEGRMDGLVINVGKKFLKPSLVSTVHVYLRLRSSEHNRGKK